MTPTVRSRTDNVRRAKARLRRNEGIRSDELLEIALLLFSEEGYREVTMKKIADRLGIRHSLIYYYFESKDKLFHSALLHALERLIAAYDEVKARHEDPVEIINAPRFCLRMRGLPFGHRLRLRRRQIIALGEDEPQARARLPGDLRL